MTPEVGQHQLVVITNDDVGDLTTAIHQHPDLPLDLGRALAHKRRQLFADDVLGGDAATVDTFQQVLLAGL